MLVQQMKLFTRGAVLFSVKTSLAAFTALTIALLLNFERPAWALTTVFVCSQLYAASTVSKSVFRLAGTLLGGIFIWLLYPETVQSPVLFSLCVSLWVAVCLYLSLSDRTPRSYIFMLAGYSAAVIGFPEVSTPYAITSTVISRIEEITLGIICSTLVHRLIMPVPMHDLMNKSIIAWYKTSQNLCSDLLRNVHAKQMPERNEIKVRMANYPLSVEGMLTHCIYDGEAARNVIRLVSIQYKHLTYLLPTLTALEARLSLLSELQVPFPDSVKHAIESFLLWLNFDMARDGINAKLNIEEAQTKLQQNWREGKAGTEETLLFTGVLERLANFIRIGEAYLNVSDRVADLSIHGEMTAYKSSRHTRHRDRGLQVLSAVTAFVATFTSCLFWIGSGWHDGANAPLMAAIISSFFANTDSPVTPMKLFIKGIILALLVSLFYIALFIPHAVTLEALIICLWPGLFLLGLLLARQSTNLIGLSIVIQLPGFIGLSHYYQPDMISTINAAIASLIGIMIAVVLSALIRNKRPSWTARRAVVAGIKDLLIFVKAVERNSSSLLTRQQFIARMIDRVNFILPRKQQDPEIKLVAGGDLISETWIGANCFDLYERHHIELRHNEIDCGQMFHELTIFLKRKMKLLQTCPHQVLLDEIDSILFKLEKIAATDNTVFTPLLSLFNIRVLLYPKVRWPA